MAPRPPTVLSLDLPLELPMAKQKAKGHAWARLRASLRNCSYSGPALGSLEEGAQSHILPGPQSTSEISLILFLT